MGPPEGQNPNCKVLGDAFANAISLNIKSGNQIMSGFNHERLAIRDTRRAAIRHEIENEKWEWSTVRIGKFNGLTMPEIALIDPAYFYWSISDRVFQGRIAREQGFIVARLAHLLPPESETIDREFRVVLARYRSLEKVSIVSAKKKRAAGTYRTPHLDVRAVLEAVAGHKRDNAGEIISAFICETYFDGRPISRHSCQAFFSNDAYYGLTCRASHRLG
jgi:hypothetical protein